MDLALDNVTLAAVDTRDAELALKALTYSAAAIRFQRVLLFSSYRPLETPRWVEFHQVDVASIPDYSTFIVKELNTYIDTPYCIIVQWDGFVIHPECWRAEFLDYDYIGAPWPTDDDWISMQSSRQQADYRRNLARGVGRVGNGGFSLRSKRLLEVSAGFPCERVEVPEDNFICMHNIDYFLDRGITFAPAGVAADFALENPVPEKTFDDNAVFGFHGRPIGTRGWWDRLRAERIPCAPLARLRLAAWRWRRRR